MPHAPRRIRRLAAGLVGIAALAAAPAATADLTPDPVAAANEAVAPPSGTKPMEDTLFPALAAMDERPDIDVSLILPGDSGWSELEAWVMAGPQRAALEALAAVTDPEDIHILGIPYGAADAPQAWCDAGLVVDTAPDGLLWHASLDYIRPLNDLVKLVYVEGARLASEGDGEQALEVLYDGVRLGRVVAERSFTQEVAWGFLTMQYLFERALDVMYVYEDAFDQNIVATAAERFDPRDLELWKIPFPMGNCYASEQLVHVAFEEKGEVDRDKLLGVLVVNDMQGARPLMAFSRAAAYEDLVNGHAGWWDTIDTIEKVCGDFKMRWEFLRRNDPVLERPSDYQRLQAAKFGVVQENGWRYPDLLKLRRHTWISLSGGHNAFGAVAFKLRNTRLPPTLPAVEPQYVALLIDDLWNIDRRFDNRAVPVLNGYEYFVPIRDQTFGRREDPRPHTVEVLFSPGGASSGPGGFDLASIEDEVMAGFEEEGLDLSDFPTELFDRASFQITDVPRLREYLRTKLNDPALIQEALASADELLEDNPLIDLDAEAMADISAGEVRERLNEQIDEAMADPEAEAMVQMLAGMSIDFDSARDLLVDIAVDYITLPEMQSAMRSMLAGNNLTEDQAVALNNAMLDTLVTERYVNGVLEIAKGPMQMLQAFGALAGGDDAASDRNFSVDIDDSQFILYSVGPDREDGEARSVGPHGGDHLIWPPISSLQREAGFSESAFSHLQPMADPE